MNKITIIAVLTATLSVVSWTYRFIDEYMRFEELAFYILVPVIAWFFFAGPLFLLRDKRKAVRITATILLVPTSALWVTSVLVGFYGLRTH